MKNRGRLIFSLLLLANKLSAQNARIEVEVYDYAGVQPSTLQKFIRGTQGILSDTGISINLVFCERTTADSCESPTNEHKKVLLRVLPGSAKKMNNSFCSPLGKSFVDKWRKVCHGIPGVHTGPGKGGKRPLAYGARLCCRPRNWAPDSRRSSTYATWNHESALGSQ